MKSVSNPVFNATNVTESGVILSKERCAELSEQLQHIRCTYNTRLSRGCAPADFPYLQQLICAIEAAQNVVEKK